MASEVTLREAAIRVLTERGPLHYQEPTQAVFDAGLAANSSATPDASLNAMIAVDIKRKGKQSLFVRIKPGVFGLRDKRQDEVLAAVDEDALRKADDEATNQRVRVPLFPVYIELRHLLRVWPEPPRRQSTGLHSTIGGLR